MEIAALTLIFWPLLAVELIVFGTWLWATVLYGR